MRGAIASLLVCAFGLSVGGCLAEPVTLDITFPFEDAFLYSSTAEIRLYDIAADESPCPQLINFNVYELGTPVDPNYDSGTVQVCDLIDGGYSFTDIGPGTRAVVVVVRDANNHTLLAGCTTASLDVGEPPIDLQLQTTLEYNEWVGYLPEPSCENMDEKCTRGC